MMQSWISSLQEIWNLQSVKTTILIFDSLIHNSVVWTSLRAKTSLCEVVVAPIINHTVGWVKLGT